MKISEQQVRYVADLANLTLTPNEIQRMAHDLDGILTHIDTLNEVDTTGVEPMAQVLFEAEETATLRADEDRPGMGSQLATANAPVAASGYFKVPRVIEK